MRIFKGQLATLISFFTSLIMTSAAAQTPAELAKLAQDFAPNGTLRASINLGNPILANQDANGQPVGVSVDLAIELAKRLKVPLSLVVFDAAGKSVDAVTHEKADFGFFAIDPVRGQGISFTGPYVLIEGSYLVSNNSPLTSNDQVDKKGIRIAVGKGLSLIHI
jgi:polar amino acid transport system substrate-binding protein